MLQVILFLYIYSFLYVNSLIVSTPIGNINGKYEETISKGTPHDAFLGIPYAAPPTGSNRFKPPKEREPFTKLWDATYQRTHCFQINFRTVFIWEGQENCLYLDIYTTAFQFNETNLAVLVWIHGGFFFTGDARSSSYNLNYFVDQHIVCVGINYRLGYLGFYHSSSVAGNMGIKDQLMALRWINKNIKYFGGDPKKVTIMGESAGAACVSYLVQTPLSKGLFQRAIMQSGNTLAGWATARQAASSTRLILKLNGMLIKFINTINLGVPGILLALVPALKMALDSAYDPMQGLLFAPVKEKISPTAIHTKDSYEVLSKCQNNSFVPVLIGHTAREGQTITQFNFVTRILSNALNNLYSIFSASLLPKDVQALAHCPHLGGKIQEYYGLYSSKHTAKFIGDIFFVLPTVEYVKMFSKCNDVYYYRFSYKDAGHGDDLYYLFANFYYKLETYKDRVMSKKLVNIWSYFIKNGKPGMKNNTLFWPKSTSGNKYTYMDINNNLTLSNITSSPHTKDISFWAKIYEQCGLQERVFKPTY